MPEMRPSLTEGMRVKTDLKTLIGLGLTIFGIAGAWFSLSGKADDHGRQLAQITQEVKDLRTKIEQQDRQLIELATTLRLQGVQP